jgi:hypothetical protein
MQNLPVDHLDKSADQQLSALWSLVSRAPYAPDGLPRRVPGALSRLKLFSVGYNRVSLEHPGDELPPERKKIIHTYGSCALVALEVQQARAYTGLFGSGAQALLRVSDADGAAKFLPALALKVPVAGHPSVNLFAMPNQHGAKTGDVFAHTYSNALPAASDLPMRLVARAFQKTAKALQTTRLYAQYLPLHEPAGIRQDGTREPTPVVPDRIELRPTGALHTSKDGQPDWRTELALLEPGTTLFDAWVAAAIDQPAEPLGRLVLKSRFVASAYGDERLFFRHDTGPRAGS